MYYVIATQLAMCLVTHNVVLDIEGTLIDRFIDWFTSKKKKEMR